jgi:hypothetical protein
MKRFVAAMAIGAILTATHPASAIAQAQKSAPEGSAAPVPPTAALLPPAAAPASPAAQKRAPPRVTRGSCAEKYRYTRVPA